MLWIDARRNNRHVTRANAMRDTSKKKKKIDVKRKKGTPRRIIYQRENNKASWNEQRALDTPCTTYTLADIYRPFRSRNI